MTQLALFAALTRWEIPGRPLLVARRPGNEALDDWGALRGSRLAVVETVDSVEVKTLTPYSRPARIGGAGGAGGARNSS